MFCSFLFNLKEWFTKKIILFTHLQAIQDLDEFLALHHLLTNGVW